MTDDLQRFQAIVQLSKDSAFQELKTLIDKWVNESHEAMIGCLGSLEIRGTLSMRYQQRLCLKREIDNWIASAQDGLEQIVEEMRRELNEHATDTTYA